MKSLVSKLMPLVLFTVMALNASAAEWETDFAKAATNAAKNNLFMLLDFSGSDWCGWCIKLDEEVFSKSDFKTYAGKNLVCVLLDFPQKKKQPRTLKDQNAELAKKYGVRGFPSVIILSPDGKLVGKTGYREGGAKAYVTHLQEMIEAYRKQHPDKAPAKTPVQAPSAPAAQ